MCAGVQPAAATGYHSQLRGHCSGGWWPWRWCPSKSLSWWTQLHTTPVSLLDLYGFMIYRTTSCFFSEPTNITQKAPPCSGIPLRASDQERSRWHSSDGIFVLERAGKSGKSMNIFGEYLKWLETKDWVPMGLNMDTVYLYHQIWQFNLLTPKLERFSCFGSGHMGWPMPTPSPIILFYMFVFFCPWALENVLIQNSDMFRFGDLSQVLWCAPRSKQARVSHVGGLMWGLTFHDIPIVRIPNFGWISLIRHVLTVNPSPCFDHSTYNFTSLRLNTSDCCHDIFPKLFIHDHFVNPNELLLSLIVIYVNSNIAIVVPSGPLSARTGDSVKLLVRVCLCSFRSL